MSPVGHINVLVNNAGVGLFSAVEEASGKEVRKNYNANVFGLLEVTRAMLPCTKISLKQPAPTATMSPRRKSLRTTIVG